MRTYLDYNASAPLRPEARETLVEVIGETGNASSPHAEGQRARARVEEARRAVADLVGAEPREVIFTGSGTEALNLAMQGSLHAIAQTRDHVIVSAVEHEAVLASAGALAEHGVKVTPAEVDTDGIVRLERIEALLGPRTALVAVMLANNETGVLQPVGDVRQVARRHGALLLVDAVQAAGKVPVDFAALGADFLALSAHKLGGPQGVGSLVVRRGAPLARVIHGGGHERGRRAGTENVAGITAFGAAARASLDDLDREQVRLARLRDRLESRLTDTLPRARVNGARVARLPGTSSITIPGTDAEALVVRLDLDGVAASTGSACASGAAEPSHVLRAMGLSPADARSTIRFSFGWGSADADADRALAALTGAVAAQANLGGPAPAGQR